MKRIYLLSLGCPRNLVDSEVLLSRLIRKRFTIVDTPEEAEIAVVNTCGFIEEAKKESTDYILRLALLKEKGIIKKLIVAGCLAQRYPSELMSEIKEIDGLFGTSELTRIGEYLDRIVSGEKITQTGGRLSYIYDHKDTREVLTPSHYVYVKIQEGCSNRCSYCVIPDLKGPLRSRTISSVVREVTDLKEKMDIKEVVLVGQDTTSFGRDNGGKSQLGDLLKEVSAIMSGRWVRLLYSHPAHFSEKLIETIASIPDMCKYIDLPIQHINDRILKNMGRGVSGTEIKRLIENIRAGIEGVAIRSSVIVGFPGEKKDDFGELMDFLEEIRFDRLGAFVYSREEGTKAGSMSGQLSEAVKKDRFDNVMSLQQRISGENNKGLMGKVLRVLIDGLDETDPSLSVGRSEMDAPEVDGVVYVKKSDLIPGRFVVVRITDTMEYDLIGEVE